MLGKGATFLVVLSLVISPILIPPKKTEAELPVIDPALVAIASVVSGVLGVIDTATSALVAKEYVLDGIFYEIVQIIKTQIVESTVNWINSGFEGNPAFLENPGQFFKDVADETLGHYLEGSEFGFICSPFQLQIRLALIEKHYGERTPRCTLSGALNNLEGGFDDFVSIDYGVNQRNVPSRIFKWSEWHSVVQPEGNPYGAYAAAEAELSLRLSTSKGSFEKELNLGRGLLSYRDCSGIPEGKRGPKNINCPIKTPGSVIETQLNKVLSGPYESLITADEINEIVSALLGQLVQQVLGSDGLSGASQSNPNFGGRSYIEALRNEASSSLNNNRSQILDTKISESEPTLDQYIRIKNQSIFRVNTSINFQNQIITRCGTTSIQATSARNTLSSTLNPINAELEDNVSIAKERLKELSGLEAELTTITDTNEFAVLFSKHTELSRLIKIELVVSNALSEAVKERDVTIPGQLNPLDSSAQTTISSCNIIR